MSKLPVKDMKGAQIGDYELADELLVYDKGLQAMHDAVVAYNAAQRQGSANTKTKGEVRGSNRKLWKQKGTGRARTGFRQSPIWRGGGVVFGPRPRDFRKDMPRKVARLAFRRAVSEKIAAGQVVVLDSLTLEQPKTKEMSAIVKNLEGVKGALFVVGAFNENLLKATRNLQKVELVSAESVNTYQMLRYPLVVVAQDAMPALEQRLGSKGA